MRRPIVEVRARLRVERGGRVTLRQEVREFTLLAQHTARLLFLAGCVLSLKVCNEISYSAGCIHMRLVHFLTALDVETLMSLELSMLEHLDYRLPSLPNEIYPRALFEAAGRHPDEAPLVLCQHL